MQKFLSDRNHVFSDLPGQLTHWNEKLTEHKTATSSHSNQLSDDIFGKCIVKKIELENRKARKDFSGIFK